MLVFLAHITNFTESQVIPLGYLGGAVAPLFFVFKKELLNCSETAPRFVFLYRKQWHVRLGCVKA